MILTDHRENSPFHYQTLMLLWFIFANTIPDTMSGFRSFALMMGVLCAISSFFAYFSKL